MHTVSLGGQATHRIPEIQNIGQTFPQKIASILDRTDMGTVQRPNFQIGDPGQTCDHPVDLFRLPQPHQFAGKKEIPGKKPALIGFIETDMIGTVSRGREYDKVVVRGFHYFGKSLSLHRGRLPPHPLSVPGRGRDSLS